MATPAKQATVKFEHYRDHKNVKRFNAVDEKSPVRSIYVDKATLKTWGDPKKIEAVIKPSS